MKCSLQ